MSDLDKFLGRSYELGGEDCFGCVRGYLQETFEIQMPNFARPRDFHTDPFFNMYRFYEDWGFHQFHDENPRIGDVFLISLGGVFPSHCAVFVGKNLILHHLPNSLSRLDRFQPKWSPRVTHKLRHPATVPKPKPAVDIHELINAPIFKDPEFQKGFDRAVAAGL